MSRFGFDRRDVSFRAVPGGVSGPRKVKVAVTASLGITISMSDEIYQQMQRPENFMAQTLEHEGRCYVRLSHCPDEMLQHAQSTFTPNRGGARVSITRHPFDIPVTHKAQEVEFELCDGCLTVQMPDWDEMVGYLLSQEEG